MRSPAQHSARVSAASSKPGDFVAGGDHDARATGGGHARGFRADAGGAGNDENFFLHGSLLM